MIPLFLGLTIANFALLSIVFGAGLMTVDPSGRLTSVYMFHITLGIATGFVTLATHVTTYTYFMATSRWIQAAGDKANLPAAEFAAVAFEHKKRAIWPVMTAIIMVMLAMFAGAAADPTVHPWWPGEVHMAVALLAIAANVACALVEFRLIRLQGALMDRALAILNNMPGVVVQHV